MKNNLVPFPGKHSDHADEQAESASANPPNPEELQRLLGQLAEAISQPLVEAKGSQEVTIRNFRSERLELIDDLMVVIEERAGQYIANSFDTGQYGHGYSPDMAIFHLCSVIEDYYELLLEDEGHLGPILESHLTYLRTILRVRQ
jgi:hypothetical protein